MSTRYLVALIACALAPACASDSTGTVIIDDDPVGETTAAGHARGGALADQSFDELVGNDFLAQVGITGSILASMNDSEIFVADFGAQLVFDADIFALANDLILDHEDANFDLDEVMRFHGVGFFPSVTADIIAGEASADVGVLRGSPEPDFDFVEIQVFNHASAQVVLDELYAAVGDSAMGDHILVMMDLNDAHLAVSQSLLATFY